MDLFFFEFFLGQINRLHPKRSWTISFLLSINSSFSFLLSLVFSHSSIGSISEGNEGSLKLCAEFGFRVVGTMRENGYKFDRWIDNTFVELIL